MGMPMSYLVFARKYRPQTFDEVVQQSHVTRTLANAIAANRVAHAILFSGPRGTGKTTVARILAKAMNCVQGPTAEPCNQCQSCLEITSGNAADVFEIDGASNNSVDQVRELRENLKYMPVNSRNKIYIIDEVHMLSPAAFNALLKTLEEPPAHILFMFATTEAHKIPITVLSRCQRHDLRRIDSQAMAKHMRRICEAEKVRIDEPSLALIAQEAGGSMRDSLSLLDHVLACAEGPVTPSLIGELLGLVDHKHLFDISEAVLRGDLHKVLATIDGVWRQGYELKRFYADLVAHFHHLTLVKIGLRAGHPLDLSEREIERMKAQTESVPEIFLLQSFDMLFQAEPSIKLSSQPKLALEMVFLKLFQTAPALPIQTLIDSLDKLQKEGPGQAGTPEPRNCPPMQSREPAQDPVISHGNKLLPEVNKPHQRDADDKDHAVDAPAVDAPAVDADVLWEKVMDRVSQQKPSLAGFLAKCRLRLVSQGRVTIEVNGNQFSYNNIARHREALEAICSEELGGRAHLELVANYEEAESKLEQKEKSSRLRQKAMGHPLVMAALELFDGRLIDIKVMHEN
jgi:DNA polymerase III subunit gamma/tau